jgi:hypothetical protein
MRQSEQLLRRSGALPELVLHGKRRGMSSGLILRFGLHKVRKQSWPQSHKNEPAGEADAREESPSCLDGSLRWTSASGNTYEKKRA